MRIELQKICVQYPDKKPLFRDLNLAFREGQFILVQGPSGSGKSSLLRVINRLQEPQEGEIRVDGKPIAQHEVTQLRRRIGYVQQVPIMLEGSVEKNLLFPFQFRSARFLEPPDSRILQDWLDRLGLNQVLLTDQAQQLSVGQKQRVALIRTLLAEPEILLCDEPTSALDRESRVIVEDSLQQLYLEKKIGIMLVTHFEVEFAKVRPKRYSLQAAGLIEARI